MLLFYLLPKCYGTLISFFYIEVCNMQSNHNNKCFMIRKIYVINVYQEKILPV